MTPSNEIDATARADRPRRWTWWMWLPWPLLADGAAFAAITWAENRFRMPREVCWLLFTATLALGTIASFWLAVRLTPKHGEGHLRPGVCSRCGHRVPRGGDGRPAEMCPECGLRSPDTRPVRKNVHTLASVVGFIHILCALVQGGIATLGAMGILAGLLALAL